MKILHIAPTPFFADRGCHIRILGEIKHLQSLGHAVVLATYHIGQDINNLDIHRIINIPWYKKFEAGGSWHKLYLDIFLLWTSIRAFLKLKIRFYWLMFFVSLQFQATTVSGLLEPL